MPQSGKRKKQSFGLIPRAHIAFIRWAERKTKQFAMSAQANDHLPHAQGTASTHCPTAEAYAPALGHTAKTRPEQSAGRQEAGTSQASPPPEAPGP